jgi:LEA14-like dessication related protein
MEFITALRANSAISNTASQALRANRGPAAFRWLSGIMFIGLFCFSLACVTPRGSMGFDEPTLNLISITPLPAEGFSQRFRLGFVIRNPNHNPLNARGMLYDIYFEDHKLLSGVTNSIPPVEGYNEDSFEVIASTHLIGSLRLIQDLMQTPRSHYEYRLKARLDLSSPVNRKINIEETGEFSLATAVDR